MAQAQNAQNYEGIDNLKKGLSVAASPLGIMVGGVMVILVLGLSAWLIVSIVTDTVTALFTIRIKMELVFISLARCIIFAAISMGWIMVSIISNFMRLFHHTVITAISTKGMNLQQTSNVIAIDLVPIVFLLFFSVIGLAISERMVTGYQTLDISADGKPYLLVTPQKAAADAAAAAADAARYQKQ